VRVLDLSYGEIAKGVTLLLAKLGGNQEAEKKLAKTLICIEEGKPYDEHCDGTQTLRLEHVKAQFLLGVQLDRGTLSFDQRWWVPRKKERINADLRVDAFLYSFASIIFLSEPRYARAMVPMTLLQLKEIAEGELTFGDAFSNLNGAIEYGQLLPGSNYIGEKLKNKDIGKEWLEVKLIHEVVLQRVPNLNTQPVTPCPAKNLRMLLGDSPAYHLSSEERCHGCSQAVTNSETAKAPEYQVLVKELFTVFLRLLTFYRSWLKDRVEEIELPVEQALQVQVIDDDEDDNVVPVPGNFAQYDQDI
jgi:hypothetical protein